MTSGTKLSRSAARCLGFSGFGAILPPMVNTRSASLRHRTAKLAANTRSAQGCQSMKWFPSVWRSALECLSSPVLACRAGIRRTLRTPTISQNHRVGPGKLHEFATRFACGKLILRAGDGRSGTCASANSLGGRPVVFCGPNLQRAVGDYWREQPLPPPIGLRARYGVLGSVDWIPNRIVHSETIIRSHSATTRSHIHAE